MKVFRKNSNLCDDDSLTSRTDGQTTCRSNTTLCVASRDKNVRRDSAVLKDGERFDPLDMLYDTIPYDTIQGV